MSFTRPSPSGLLTKRSLASGTRRVIDAFEEELTVIQ